MWIPFTNPARTVREGEGGREGGREGEGEGEKRASEEGGGEREGGRERESERRWWMILLQDGLVLHHWRRVADEGKEYPFAKFNKTPDIPTYTDEDYTVSGSCDCHTVSCDYHMVSCDALQKCLTEPGWSKEETDHLFDLCR